jgi:HAD superfamily hydrolase (TIGR01662 family)
MSATDPWAILFDLDDTLVQTAQLDALRRRRAWQDVYRALDRSLLADGTAELIEAARGLGRIGVVTMAPRPYAERVLAHHGLQIDVLVAYHDVQLRKPHPEPILKAARMLDVPPERTVYIGDQPNDLVSAHRAGSYAIGLSGGSLQAAPEAKLAVTIAREWPEVLAALHKLIGG